MALGVACAALFLVSAPAALAGDGGKITRSELDAKHHEKANLFNNALSYVNSMDPNEQGCRGVKESGDQREIKAFKRAMKLNAEDARDDSSKWEPLGKWGAGLHKRANSYDDPDDVQRVRTAGNDIVLGSASGQSALEHVATVDDALAQLDCNPNRPEKQARDLFDRATKRLGDAFEDLDRVVGHV
jgi:hypothetical protein